MEPPAPKRPQHTKLVKGRWYWDPPDRLRASHGIKTVALGPNESDAWRLAERLNRDHLEVRDDQPTPGTVSWLFRQFEASKRFEKLSEGTQRDYRWLGKLMESMLVGNTKLGRLPAMAIKPRHADGLFAVLLDQKSLHAAHYACRYARRVWHWGFRKEFVGAINPWSDMELPSLPARKQRWTPEQVAAVVAAAKAAGRPSLGLATVLAYWLGHRQADVLAMTWADVAAGYRETAKTGVELPLAVHAYPDLLAAMNEAPRAGEVVIVHEGTKAAYNRYTFNHDWREVATQAGIPRKLQFRDLRATAATELADSGADDIEMSSHHGWTDPKMRRRYARRTTAQAENAARKRLAGRDAGSARETIRETGKPPLPGREQTIEDE